MVVELQGVKSISQLMKWFHFWKIQRTRKETEAESVDINLTTHSVSLAPLEVIASMYKDVPHLGNTSGIPHLRRRVSPFRIHETHQLEQPWVRQCHDDQRSQDTVFYFQSQCCVYIYIYINLSFLELVVFNSIKRICNLNNVFSVPPIGRSGELLLFWKPYVYIDVISFSTGYIDVVLRHNEEQQFSYLTCFYGNPAPHLRYQSWQLLQRIGSQRNQPWLCMGDFNELIFNREREDRLVKSDKQMADFGNTLDTIQLHDLGVKKQLKCEIFQHYIPSESLLYLRHIELCGMKRREVRNSQKQQS